MMPHGPLETFSAPHVVSLTDVSLSYGSIKALQDISLTIGRGECVALLGDNGAGKSSIVKTIMGIEHPYRGTVSIHGTIYHTVTPMIAHKEGITWVPQDLSANNFLSIYENFFLGREMHRRGLPFIAKRSMERAFEEACRTYGVSLTRPAKAQMSSLTKGKRQLFELLRTVYFPSSLVILDEPSTSLSREDKKIMNAIMSDLRRRGCAILFATHKVQDVYEWADRFIILYNGSIGIKVSKDDVSMQDVEKMLISSHLGAVREMAGSITHQIRNPLAVMKVSAQILKDEFLGSLADRKSAERVDAIMDLIHTVDFSIERFFSFARDKTSSHEYQAISTAIDSAIQRIPGSLREKVSIRKHLTVPVGTSVKVPDYTVRLITHVLASIIEVSPPGDTIDILVTNERTLQLVISFSQNDVSQSVPNRQAHGSTMGFILFQHIFRQSGASMEIGPPSKKGRFIRLTLPERPFIAGVTAANSQ